MPTEKTILVRTEIREADLPKIAESIIDEWKARKEHRKDSEKIWDEVDRQLSMVPELSHKQDTSGKVISSRAWMPEVELPLQSQTLEMLLSDNRRLKFPSNRDWFKCRAALTEKYLARFDAAGTVILGERGEADFVLNQDNADRLAQAQISHWHSQYDFRSNLELVDADAFKYGFGVGRVRNVKRRILGHDARLDGSKEQRIPVLIPRSARKVFRDDSQHAIMHEGFTLGPNILQERTMKHADLLAAAAEGGDDPKNEDGGYLLSQIQRLTPEKNGDITLIELEGDLVIETSTETIIEQDIVVTAAIGKKGKASSFGLVRVREGNPFSTYLFHDYNIEGPELLNGASPLMKGMPVAKTAAQALNRVLESAQLKNGPPIGYPRDDIAFAADGGPIIEPYALWNTIEDIKVHIDIGGDPTVLLTLFTALVNLYYDVTGVNQPRLGAQTKSHTTAFAKDVEITQGSIRTVDYVRTTLEGPMTRLLQLEYRMGLKDMRGRNTIFVAPWNEFVSIERRHLPDIVHFDAFGAAAPAEDQAEIKKRLDSAQLAVGLDQMAQQAGASPTIDMPALIRRTLEDGGWVDVTEITNEQVEESAQEPADVA